MSDFYAADVVQFMRPDGRKKNTCTDLPVSSESLYMGMRLHGYRFEAEVLSTGTVSLTISNEDCDVDCEIVPNGPEVQSAMEAMLRRRKWES